MHKYCIFIKNNNKTSFWILIQSNLSDVTFQGNIEIGSHKTGGHKIEVVTKYRWSHKTGGHKRQVVTKFVYSEQETLDLSSL